MHVPEERMVGVEERGNENWLEERIFRGENKDSMGVGDTLGFERD